MNADQREFYGYMVFLGTTDERGQTQIGWDVWFSWHLRESKDSWGLVWQDVLWVLWILARCVRE